MASAGIVWRSVWRTVGRIGAAARCRSVRALTTLVATTAVALVLVAAVAGLAVAVEQSLTSRVKAQGEAEVDAVVERLLAGATPAEALEPSLVDQSSQREAPTYVAILDTDGNPVTGAVWDLPGAAEDGVGITVRGFTAGGTRAPEVVSVGSNLAIAQRSVENDERLLLVVAVSPLAEVVNSVDTIVQLAWVGVPLLILIVGLITWFATGQTLRPIETIRSEVEAVSSRTLDHRVAVPATDDEVSRLAETMNRMLARLDVAGSRQREFVSDASHELRSPVASIRAELEVALAHPTASTWPDVANNVLAETERLERIIDDLLLLARYDEGAAPAATIVDTGSLARESAARIDDAMNVVVKIDIVDGLLVQGSHHALTSVVRNLVDNAARYADSTLTVTTAAGDGMVVLTIDDDGPGIPVRDRERVFHRFTRLDHPRSRADGGVGLGLAVVERVVQGHNGTVTVGEAPLGGARFQVVLPAVLRDEARARSSASAATSTTSR